MRPALSRSLQWAKNARRVQPPWYEESRVLNILICEDNKEDEAQLRRALGACSLLRDVDHQIESFSAPHQLLRNYDAQETDILFLDILMQDETGIDIARKVREHNADIPIVFVTSSPDYAVASYDVNATHYLMKPATPAAVDVALARCKRIISAERRAIEVVSGRMTERVLVHDVIYAETFGHRTLLHLRNRTIETTTPLAKIDEAGGRSFLRCHRSFMVNMDHVSRVMGKGFLMDDGHEVPIRANGAAQVVAAYHDYLFEAVREL